MEHNHFRHLPVDADLRKISDAVIHCVKSMKKHGYSWPHLAKLVNDAGRGGYEINENTLKSFVSRGTGQRTNKSDTLEALYNYIIEHQYKFSHEIRAEIAGHFDDLKPEYNTNGESRRSFERSMEHVFGGLLLNWLGTTPEQVNKYQRELCGRYYLFRKSVRNEYFIVRSELNIEQIAPKDISVTHFHHDRYDETRVSRGFLVPAEHNFFSILNIENGISIEHLALKKPTTEKFKRLQGFIISINSNGVLVCARSVILKREKINFEPEIRFHREKYKDDTLQKTLGFLDEDRAMTIPDKTELLYKLGPDD